MIVSTVRTNHNNMDELQPVTFCTIMLLSFLFLSLPPKKKKGDKRERSYKRCHSVHDRHMVNYYYYCYWDGIRGSTQKCKTVFSCFIRFIIISWINLFIRISDVKEVKLPFLVCLNKRLKYVLGQSLIARGSHNLVLYALKPLIYTLSNIFP